MTLLYRAERMAGNTRDTTHHTHHSLFQQPPLRLPTIDSPHVEWESFPPIETEVVLCGTLVGVVKRVLLSQISPPTFLDLWICGSSQVCSLRLATLPVVASFDLSRSMDHIRSTARSSYSPKVLPLAGFVAAVRFALSLATT